MWEDDFRSLFDLVRVIYIVDIWKLRKDGFYDKNPSGPKSRSQNSSEELGNVGDGGKLSCVHSKVDTNI